jgi:hypothetical protein
MIQTMNENSPISKMTEFLEVIGFVPEYEEQTEEGVTKISFSLIFNDEKKFELLLTDSGNIIKDKSENFFTVGIKDAFYYIFIRSVLNDYPCIIASSSPFEMDNFTSYTLMDPSNTPWHFKLHPDCFNELVSEQYIECLKDLDITYVDSSAPTFPMN